MKQFRERVIAVVHAIPKGKVMSYGQVAAAAGWPRGARQVGWILHEHDGKDDLPWWRVVNNQGQLTIKGNMFSTAELQKQLLEAEGIAIDADFSFDIEKYRYKRV
jgi:methylated-DNA-protein-cysteine methyltransferase related protein